MDKAEVLREIQRICGPAAGQHQINSYYTSNRDHIIAKAREVLWRDYIDIRRAADGQYYWCASGKSCVRVDYYNSEEEAALAGLRFVDSQNNTPAKVADAIRELNSLRDEHTRLLDEFNNERALADTLLRQLSDEKRASAERCAMLRAQLDAEVAKRAETFVQTYEKAPKKVYTVNMYQGRYGTFFDVLIGDRKLAAKELEDSLNNQEPAA